MQWKVKDIKFTEKKGNEDKNVGHLHRWTRNEIRVHKIAGCSNRVDV